MRAAFKHCAIILGACLLYLACLAFMAVVIFYARMQFP